VINPPTDSLYSGASLGMYPRKQNATWVRAQILKTNSIPGQPMKRSSRIR